jgi:acyl-CoA thioesterase FadM
MSSIRIQLPEKFIFETEIPIRITDLNYVGHLGNDSFLSIIHDARAQFLRKYGYTELNVEGVGTIVNNAIILYKNQLFYGDTVIVKVALKNPGHMSCDFIYFLVDKKTGKEAARAQTGFVFLDYKSGNLMEMPDKFRALFSL